jgi:hypothetical protein
MRGVLAVILCLAASVAFAEQITNLPQDQNKWYISVVGDTNDATYQTVLGWFDANPDLKSLKDQCHWCPVTIDNPMYTDRYAPTTKALPMVRVQDAQGNILAEIAGKNIPSTGERLYNAIGVQVEFRLPHLKHRRHPQPKPEPPRPQPVIVVHVDPPPQPLSDGGSPQIRVRHVCVALAMICLVCLAAGIIFSRRNQHAS